MSPNQESLLIDHLDNHLRGIPSPGLDQLLAEDAEAAQQWERLRLAVEGLKDKGLYEQVGKVRSAWEQQQKNTPHSTSVLYRFARITVRVAAVLLVVSGGIAVYKYSSTSAAGMYSRNYIPFQLGEQRGANGSRSASTQAIEQAYRENNWNAVIEDFKQSAEVNNETRFLAGIASLQMRRYDEAIGHFQQVLAANFQSHGSWFQEDAEYYLAMSWLARNNAREAMPLIIKIKLDPLHAYHDQVMKLSRLDLWIVRYKE